MNDSHTRHPRLSKEEEITLGKKIAKGDKQALDKLVTSNLALVRYVANRYIKKGMDYEDLICEGNIGLVEAASRWNYKKCTRFSTYATFWVRKTILLAFNSKMGLVTTPTNLSGATNSLYNKLQRLETEGHGKLSPSQIKKKFGKKYQNHPIDRVISKMNVSYCGVEIRKDNESYDRAEGGLVTESFERELENADGEIKLKEKLKKILHSVRYGDVVDDLFGISNSNPESFEALSRRNKVTQQAVHAWRTIAFDKIRKRYSPEEFLDYLRA